MLNQSTTSDKNIGIFLISVLKYKPLKQSHN